MKFCAIIPDRNDRPELLKHCYAMLNKQTVKPEAVYLMNHDTGINGFDLVDRVKLGVDLAIQDGFEWCFIIENDDMYPANYFERFQPFMESADFMGQEYSFYYNLRNLTYNRFDHWHRASLFTTAFRISALNNFTWPPNNKPFLDIELWKYARHKRRRFIETGAIGIKHGLGLCGGKGHKFDMRNKDPKLDWLRGKVDQESFEFYRELHNKLQMQPA